MPTYRAARGGVGGKQTGDTPRGFRMTMRWFYRALGVAAVAAAVAPATAAASGSPGGPPSLPTSTPFQQCAAVYLDSSCGYLVDITGSGSTSTVYVDPSVGYYEGSDDVLVGVQND